MQDIPSLAGSYFLRWAFFIVNILFQNWDTWFWFTQILNFNLRRWLFEVFCWLSALFRWPYWGFGPWRALLLFLNRRGYLYIDLLFKRLLYHLFLKWFRRLIFFIFIWIVHIIKKVNLFFMGLRYNLTALIQILRSFGQKIMLPGLWLRLSLRGTKIVIGFCETWKSYFLWLFRRTALYRWHVFHIYRFVLAGQSLETLPGLKLFLHQVVISFYFFCFQLVQLIF